MFKFTNTARTTYLHMLLVGENENSVSYEETDSSIN